MDVDIVKNLREWAPLSDLLHKIPAKVQKNFFYQDLSITCVDVLPDFIALGSDAGIVFWYNRASGNVQKLRSEITSPITCVQIISSVEYMVSAGSACGQVSVFQIQKDHPPDLNLVAPLTRAKPIERYTIRDLHQTVIRCVEWSKNGMKLFSGDKNGVIVLTEFDFQTHISKSMVILNEAYDIVQISFSKPWLLISTVYRAVVCEKSNDGNWRVSQIGKKDRKVLSDFGITFLGPPQRPSIVTVRPGFRFWIADTQGNVAQTVLLKDAVTAVKSRTLEVPLLNPGRLNSQAPINFGRCIVFKDQFIVTHNDSVVYMLDLESLKVVAVIRRLRRIDSLVVCGSEIFIVEGARSVVRISDVPDTTLKSSVRKTVFNSPMTTSAASFEPPVEFEAEDETVISAEECFELPPIEHISLETPLQVSMHEHDLLQQDKLFLEHSRRVEVYEKINQLDYDDSILFNAGQASSGTKKKKIKSIEPITSKTITNLSGIVEIGQLAELTETAEVQAKKSTTETTTRPCLLDASFCDGVGIVPDLRSPDTISKELEPKEAQLAAALNIEPINCAQVIVTHSIVKLTPDIAPEFHYPFDYVDSATAISSDRRTCHTTPLKRMHFICDDDVVENVPQLRASGSTDDRLHGHAYDNLCDDMKTVISAAQHLQNQPTMVCPASGELPAVERVPDFMQIPNLWNVEIETMPLESSAPISGGSSGSSSSDWELVDNL